MGDFNGDGKLDLAVTNATSSSGGNPPQGIVSIFLGNGKGGFKKPVNFPVGLLPYSIVSGDFNGDGKLDLAVANTGGGSTPGTVSILLGDGNGTFQKQKQFPVGTNLFPHSITVGDFNGDGKLDVATAESGASNSVSVLLGKGDGTLESPKIFAAGNVLFGIAAADINGDGKLDLVVANFETIDPGTISILLGKGDGTFEPQVQFPAGDEPYSVVAADLTGNGKVDLVAPDFFSFAVAVLLNQTP